MCSMAIPGVFVAFILEVALISGILNSDRLKFPGASVVVLIGAFVLPFVTFFLVGGCFGWL